MAEGERDMMKLTISMKKPSDRSEFEKTFLANYAQLSKIIQMRSKIGDGNRVFNSQNPGHPVAGQKDLINLDQKGTRLEERTRKTVRYSLNDILTDATLLSKCHVMSVAHKRMATSLRPKTGHRSVLLRDITTEEDGTGITWKTYLGDVNRSVKRVQIRGVRLVR